VTLPLFALGQDRVPYLFAIVFDGDQVLDVQAMQ
jgi:hypothetical protein